MVKTGISVIAYYLLPVAFGKYCLKNDDIKWREGNIYECNDPDKPECCEEDLTFTCCASNMSVEDQFILWGCVAGFILIVAVLCLYYRRGDESGGCCTFDENGLLGSLRQRCSKTKDKLSSSFTRLRSSKNGHASFSRSVSDSQQGTYHSRQGSELRKPRTSSFNETSFSDSISLNDGNSEPDYDIGVTGSKYAARDKRKTWA